MKLSDEEYSLRKPHCLECGKEMAYGRPDRKFCSSRCKNKFHNHTGQTPRLTKLRVQHTLDRNYKILNTFLAAGLTSVPIATLVVMGFNPMYSTCVIHSGRTHTYMCFDIKYSMSCARVYQMEVTSELPK